MNFIQFESPTETKRRLLYSVANSYVSFQVGACQNGSQRILEPSCGDGAFISALSSLKPKEVVLTGIELLEDEAAKARKIMQTTNFTKSDVINDDFLEWSLASQNSLQQYDAVLGNPPYIRYQYLKERDQEFTAEIFANHNLKFTKHTNLWVPFIIASVALLKPGGRLAMVVPSEILHVLHAQPLRQFLFTTCGKILLIDPNELLFVEALQGTVLLMLKKTQRKGSSNAFCFGNA